MADRQPPLADAALRLNSGATYGTAGQDRFGLATPPHGRHGQSSPCANGDGNGGDTPNVDRAVGYGGRGGSQRRGDEGGGGTGHAIVTAGLVVWAAGASLVAAFFAANRGFVHTATVTTTTAATTTTPAEEPAAAGAASFGATTTTAAVSSKPRSSSYPKFDGDSNGDSGKSWCLPNAAHQNFTGVVLKEDDGLLPKGKWEGQHWWYHDEITSGFHMVATIGGETYGFWDLGIIGASGNTEYVAAYKGSECLYYEEEVQPGSTPFDEDVTCRGSAWAGNVTLQEEMEFGYGTKTERWAGVIREDEDTGYGGLPPGTESLIDLQRNPDNDGEVRLLYHRVVAPTEGVLRWAGGDSVTFDLVFTGLEKMTAGDVLGLVKVPGICEVMAGEFHDQQARGNTGTGGVRGRARARSRALRGETAETGDRRGGRGVKSGARSAGVATVEAGGERSRNTHPVVVGTAREAEAAGLAAAATSTPIRNRDGSGASLQAGDWSKVDVGKGGGPRRLTVAALAGEDEETKQGKEGPGGREGLGDGYTDGGGGRGGGASALARPDAADARADPDDPTVAGADGRGRGEARSAQPETAAAQPGLLPMHHLMRTLGRKGFRRRG
ncbi:unnamed protein product [Scytosiphon promiscuus]